MPARSDIPKQQLLSVTIELLKTHDPERLTVREIASAAGVAPGQINYHFGSRDTLIREAVSTRLRELASNILDHPDQHGSPRDLLRHALKEGSRFSMAHAGLMETTVRWALAEGDLDAIRLIEPLVAEILRVESPAEQQHSRLLSFQLFTIVEAVFLHRAELKRYCNLDFADDAQRDDFLDHLVERFLPKRDEGSNESELI